MNAEACRTDDFTLIEVLAMAIVVGVVVFVLTL